MDFDQTASQKSKDSDASSYDSPTTLPKNPLNEDGIALACSTPLKKKDSAVSMTDVAKTLDKLMSSANNGKAQIMQKPSTTGVQSSVESAVAPLAVMDSDIEQDLSLESITTTNGAIPSAPPPSCSHYPPGIATKTILLKKSLICLFRRPLTLLKNFFILTTVFSLKFEPLTQTHFLVYLEHSLI